MLRLFCRSVADVGSGDFFLRALTADFEESSKYSASFQGVDKVGKSEEGRSFKIALRRHLPKTEEHLVIRVLVVAQSAKNRISLSN